MSEFLSRLRAELGDAVSVRADELEAMRTDRSGWRSEFSSIALVNARDTADVQTTLRLATEFGVPVVTRGAGTGLAGGANSSKNSVVLSVAGLNSILSIEPHDELAVVQPGVLNGDLNDALAEYGLWFAPDPASRAISSIGGNIATNAGGLLCAKYGVTREAVLGLTVVLADGRILHTGHRTVKGVTGYDLTSLFVGSEGTLGVIVEATVRTLPIPRGDTITIGAVFPDVASAARASAAITATRLRPAVMELLDAPSLAVIQAYIGDDVMRASIGSTGDGSYLLVQFDAGACEAVRAEAVRCIENAGGRARTSTDPETGDRLLAIRRAFHPSLAAQGQVLIEDVAVPRSRLPEMFSAIQEISNRYGISIPTVAHAGDGNLHPNFVFQGEQVPAFVWDAAGELFAAALKLGGTLTGEHGVGVLKRRWLREELGDDSYQLQRQLKAMFDPADILNPGVMFEE
ncbi:FAD-binding oxidoreductase [Rathayibacter soli]|uniref:FAD-binding oxidoreductase n=1 Tax=Rathayibacter soli TaxID=3144168 RepID=UPI0027E50304|nr:FAD-linked oxidase C-terminal domain-containing protein [Glaciibacter superstes]